jgi:hypothetical protein
VNSIVLTFCLLLALFMFDLPFLFLIVYFEFGSEIFRIVKTYLVNAHNFVSIFLPLTY